MYTDASYGRTADVARMTFSFVRPEDKNGVSFYYHMNGQDIGALEVGTFHHENMSVQYIRFLKL